MEPCFNLIEANRHDLLTWNKTKGNNTNVTKKPRINTLIGYSLSEEAHINKISKPTQISLVQLENGDLISKNIDAFGKIGFGINAYDRLDGAINRNGLYSLEMTVNCNQVFQFTANKFSFSESRLINSYIDFERLIKLKQRVQKCYVEHEMNNLSLYKKLVNMII